MKPASGGPATAPLNMISDGQPSPKDSSGEAEGTAALKRAREREQHLRTTRSGTDQVLLAKEDRKALELDAMRQERAIAASRWSPAEAASKAARHIADHKAQGDPPEREFLRTDMRLFAAANAHYAKALSAAAPELLREERAHRQAPAREASDPEQARRKTLISGLSERFVIDGNQYRFRGNEKRTAFEDHGSRLTSVHDSPSVVRGLVDLAEAKGWKALRIGQDSSAEFRKAVWVEASARGIRTVGHEPSPSDRERLERELLARQSRSAGPPDRSRARPSAVAELIAREAAIRGVSDPDVLARLRQAAEGRETALADSGRTVVARVVDPSIPRFGPQVVPPLQQERARPARGR